MKDIKLTGLSHEEWLQERRNGIGGSDISAIMKQSPWNTPLSVYLDKIGESEPIEDNDAMKAGRMLEGAVADWFIAENPEYTARKDDYMRRHPNIPFMLANSDRVLMDTDGNKGILEIKTTSSFYSRTWTEEIAYQYYLQLQFYLAVYGYSYGYIALLIDGRDFRTFYYNRDENVINEIETACKDFWNNHVLKKIPPEPMSPADLNALYPTPEPLSTKEMDVIDRMNVDGYNEAKRDESEAKSRKEKFAFELKKSLGKIESMVDNGCTVATLKANSKGTRVLNVKSEEI